MDRNDEKVAREVGGKGFRCTNCGAHQIWSPEHQGLRCGHCEHVDPVESTVDQVAEIPVDQGFEIAPRGLGMSRRTLDCQECGARISVDPAAISTRCDFCASSRVVVQDEEDDRIRPQALLPMAHGSEAARRFFRRWLAKLWFRPNALTRVGRAELVGLYVPYWSFDAQVDSEWSAQSGTYYWVSVPYTTTVNGQVQHRTRQERRIRWRSASGDRSDRYDDVLVCGSRSLPKKLVDRLNGFDTGQLVDYRPEYLAGYRAERYVVKLEPAYEAACDLMTVWQDERCKGDIPGDTHRAFRSSHLWSQETFKHILLPIWLLSYRFKGERYQVLINGQTGEVEGKAPYSWAKIGLAVLLAAALAFALWFFMSRR